MRRVLVVLALGACRLGFEEHSLDIDAPVQADADALVIDATPIDADPRGPSLCGMAPGTWSITVPVPLASVNDALFAQFPTSDRSEFDPVFSADGLTLWFTSDQSGRFLVWRATRPSLEAEFDLVEQLGPDVNAAKNQMFGFQVIANGRSIITAPYTGELGGGDYWLGAGSPVTWSPTSLSTPLGDGDARLSATGLEVFLVRGNGDTRDIYRATRTDIDRDFGPESLIAEVNTALSDSSPVPVDGGVFVVANTVAGSGDEDIYYSELVGNEYAPPFLLVDLRSASFDGEPTMIPRAVGCEIVFISERDGSFDLYRAYVQPL